MNNNENDSSSSFTERMRAHTKHVHDESDRKVNLKLGKFILCLHTNSLKSEVAYLTLHRLC